MGKCGQKNIFISSDVLLNALPLGKFPQKFSFMGGHTFYGTEIYWKMYNIIWVLQLCVTWKKIF